LRRIIILAALAVLAIPAAALADAPPPPTAPTPLAAPTPPAAVTDEATASPFARAFLIAHASDLVPGARALEVTVQACDQVDSVQRYYCLAKARLFTVQRITVVRYFVRAHARRAHAAGDDPPGGEWTSQRDRRHNRPVRVVLFRVRLFSCVAVVRILGGPAVTPTATIPVRDCVQVNRLGQPAPTPTPY